MRNTRIYTYMYIRMAADFDFDRDLTDRWIN